uniref:ESX-1 secretion-associated protein EspA n=1 Tax=Macrostomum lignano TaxID=282301 RepID=A0A1I8JNP2_9PLAT
MGYRCPNYSFRIRHMRTDKPESTFVRGPGPAFDILATTGGDNFQRMWSELLQLADIEARRKEIEEFNKVKELANTFRKRGLDMTAVSYQIATIAGGLAASTSEWNCQAAVNAAEQINQRLETLRLPIHRTLGRLWWARLCPPGSCLAAMECEDFGVHGKTPPVAKAGRVLQHRGRRRGSRGRRPHGPLRDRAEWTSPPWNVGRSINPGVDIGQIEAPSVMGNGLLPDGAVPSMMARFWANLTDSLGVQKVPQAPPIPPRDYRDERSNAGSAMSTKAIGEPTNLPAPLWRHSHQSAPWSLREAAGQAERHLNVRHAADARAGCSSRCARPPSR